MEWERLGILATRTALFWISEPAVERAVTLFFPLGPDAFISGARRLCFLPTRGDELPLLVVSRQRLEEMSIGMDILRRKNLGPPGVEVAPSCSTRGLFSTSNIASRWSVKDTSLVPEEPTPH